MSEKDYNFIKYDITPIIYEDISYIAKKNEKLTCEIELLNKINNEQIIGIVKIYLNNQVVKETFIYRYY